MESKTTNFWARKIYEQVRDMIHEETLMKHPGEPLESEMQYAAKFGVSRATVRKAVDELIRSGIVRRIPGKGLMIAEEPVKQKNTKLLISMPFIIGDGCFYNVTMGCLQKANELGYDYKVINDSLPSERLKQFMTESLSDYDAFILTSYESPEEAKMVSLVKASGKPYILVGSFPEGTDEPAITSDDFSGGYIMAEYMLKHGHANILYISSTRPVHPVFERERGFRQALLDYGINPKEKNIIHIDDPGIPRWEPKYLDEIVKDITSSECTAICGYSSIPIISICSRLIQKGISIPDNYSVIAFDDTTYIDIYSFSLTSIQAETADIGINAVSLLDDVLSGRTSKVESAVLDVHLQKGKTVKRIGPGLIKKSTLAE